MRAEALRWGYVMEKVTLDLKHCYGIKALTKELDFSGTQAYAIYAPNGVMKSSLAQTFQDAADERDSEDRIFPDRETIRRILDEAGNEVEGERVLVVKPYDEAYGPTEKTSTLLVDATLRKEYEELQATIDEAKSSLLQAIRGAADSKSNFEQEIISAFTSGDDFEVAVTRIRDELDKQKDAPFANVKYDVIFNDKVLKAIEAQDVKDAVEEYIRRYNELLDASTFFRKGFDYYNAGQIAKSLADNGFFDAKHTINLKSTGDTVEINTQEELESVIQEEKKIILQDDKLRKKFDEVAKKLQRNAELRTFCRYLQDNEALLSRMNNLPKFKEDILKSYLKENYTKYCELLDKYSAVAKRKAAIEEEARKQETQWEEVIGIFNDRFVVPFELETRNRIQVMLGNEPIVELGFTYKDGTDTAKIEKSDLLRVLSNGERKALYVLNVIFEVQRRNKDKLETLIVVDDIADSFDYQNKYAIIQYLDDISKDGLFKLIIMTHNFDFFRTIESRKIAGYKHCLMASKNDKNVSLIQAAGIRNVFAHDWKINFFKDAGKKIASIPFLRNLIEMTTGENDPKFQQLTMMLHWKPGSEKITVGELDGIFNALCEQKGTSDNAKALVHDVIQAEAQGCLKEGGGLDLQNKIVLAIGIRIAAERFVIKRINDEAFVASIEAHQTQALIRRFKDDFPAEVETVKILDRVALMTPENIHVNSFMYEPIVDMADDHLKRLYGDVSKLA